MKAEIKQEVRSSGTSCMVQQNVTIDDLGKIDLTVWGRDADSVAKLVMFMATMNIKEEPCKSANPPGSGEKLKD